MWIGRHFGYGRSRPDLGGYWIKIWPMVIELVWQRRTVMAQVTLVLTLPRFERDESINADGNPV